MKKIIYILVALLFIGFTTGCEITLNGGSNVEKTFRCSL